MRKLILALSLAGSLFGGVASANEGWYRDEGVRSEVDQGAPLRYAPRRAEPDGAPRDHRGYAPPPAPVEYMPRLRGYEWIPGGYRLIRGRYVMLPGHYQRVHRWRDDGWRRG